MKEVRQKLSATAVNVMDLQRGAAQKHRNNKIKVLAVLGRAAVGGLPLKHTPGVESEALAV